MSDLFPNLAVPQIIEELSFETILSEMMTDAQTRFDAAGINYDVGNLETDPVKIILEAAAYREVQMRARANDVARAQILSFSIASDLDHLGSFYGVTRLVGETDAAMRVRIVDAIRGRSTAGPKHWYAYHARSADVKVKDVAVDLDPTAPKIIVSVLSTDNGGIATQPLLDTVSAALNADDVKVVSDIVSVRAAVFTSVNVTAQITLRSGVAQSVFDGLSATLSAAWAAKQAMGEDMTVSWLIATLMQPGVYKAAVTSPAADVEAAANQALALGTVTLTLAGYDI